MQVTALPFRLLMAALLSAAVLLSASRSADDDKKEKKPAADAKKIAKLIDDLGDDDEDIRKAAEKALGKLGEDALVALKKAAKSHADADVRLRAVLLARTLEGTVYGGLKKYIGHTKDIRHIAVSKDGKKALTGAMDNTARLWDIEDGKELKKLTGHMGWAWSVDFNKDGKKALTSGGYDGTLRTWDLSDGKELKKIEGHKLWVYGAAWSPDGKKFLSGGAGTNEKTKTIDDTSVRIWDAETGKELKKLDGHKGYVWKVAYSPDGKKAASAGSNDKTFRIWDMENEKLLIEGKDAHGGSWVMGVAFTPDSKKLLTCGRDGTAKLWDAETGKILKTYTGAKDTIECIAISKDGKRILAGSQDVVYVFDTESAKIIHRFEEHKGNVWAVAFLPDGRKALSGGEDKVMRLWGVPR